MFEHRNKNIAVTVLTLGVCLAVMPAFAAQDVALPALEGSPIIVALDLSISVTEPARCEVFYEGTFIDACHLQPGINEATFQVSRCYETTTQPGSTLQVVATDYQGNAVDFSLLTDKSGEGRSPGSRASTCPPSRPLNPWIKVALTKNRFRRPSGRSS